MSIYTENQKTVTLKLKRRDVCDLLLVTAAAGAANVGTVPDDMRSKWNTLHDLLLDALDAHDRAQEEAKQKEEFRRQINTAHR